KIGLVWRLIAGRRDPKLEHLGQPPQMLRERLGVVAVAALDRHAIFKQLPAFRQPRRQVCNRESVVADKLVHVLLAHHSIARKAEHAMRVATAPMIAAYQNPMPTRMPIAAVIQMDAAVVRPRTVKPSLKITPAPRNPMPVMMPCAIRVGSARMVSSGTSVIQCNWRSEERRVG